MAHFAFICVPTAGHLDPMVALARELTARGHSATFLHHPEVGPIIERYGMTFVALGDGGYPAGELDEAIGRATRVKGLFGIRALIRDFARSAALLCEELPRVLRALAVDVIVSDWIEPASGLVALHMRMPYVSVANALPLNWEDGIPSPFVGWAYGASRWNRYRNIAAQYVVERTQRPLHDVIRTYASRWKLGPRWQVGHCASAYAQIAQLTRSLDYPRQSLIGCFHYCGPLRRAAAAEPLHHRDRQPCGRVFASLGSLQGHRVDIFERIADAAEACGLELTLAHGGRLAPRDVERLSRRAIVHDFIAYDRILPEVDVAIMHGGMNGVLDALAHGVPLVTIPLAYEQGAIASRVRWAGAGVVCRPRALRWQLARAIREVRTNPAYAEAAAGLADEIRAAGGVQRAADIIEEVARTRQPCLNAEGLARRAAMQERSQGSAPG